MSWGAAVLLLASAQASFGSAARVRESSAWHNTPLAPTLRSLHSQMYCAVQFGSHHLAGCVEVDLHGGHEALGMPVRWVSAATGIDTASQRRAGAVASSAGRPVTSCQRLDTHLYHPTQPQGSPLFMTIRRTSHMGLLLCCSLATWALRARRPGSGRSRAADEGMPTCWNRWVHHCWPISCATVIRRPSASSSTSTGPRCYE